MRHVFGTGKGDFLCVVHSEICIKIIFGVFSFSTRKRIERVEKRGVFHFLRTCYLLEFCYTCLRPPSREFFQDIQSLIFTGNFFCDCDIHRFSSAERAIYFLRLFFYACITEIRPIVATITWSLVPFSWWEIKWTTVQAKKFPIPT